MDAVGDENRGCPNDFENWDFNADVIDCFTRFNHPRAKCDNLIKDDSIWASFWSLNKKNWKKSIHINFSLIHLFTKINEKWIDPIALQKFPLMNFAKEPCTYYRLVLSTYYILYISGFICAFSLLVFLSITLRTTNSLLNWFTINHPTTLYTQWKPLTHCCSLIVLCAAGWTTGHLQVPRCDHTVGKFSVEAGVHRNEA